MRLKHILFLSVIVVLPLVFSLSSPRFAENLRIFSYSLVKPILQMTQSVSVVAGKVYEQVRDFHRVYVENERLRREVAETRKHLTRQKELIAENERLKKLFGFKQELGGKSVAAHVIARDISYWSRWVVLDKGIDDGVLPGMVLVSEEGLVGRIISAGKHVARGILIIDGESRVSVVVQTTRDLGLMEGRGDSLPLIRLIPRDAKLAKGDAIITSGLGGIYPKGIPVGLVESISEDKDGLHKSATLKPFADMSKLEEVLCLSVSVPS